MTSEQKPGAFARAETGARQVVLQLGLGMLAFVLGSFVTAGLVSRLADRLGTVDSEWTVFAFGWLLQRVWLFFVLPLFAYGIGRFSGIALGSFTLMAALTGETFMVLLASAMDGFEVLVADPRDLVARLVTLFAGMWLVHRAGLAGRAEAAIDQADALAAAERRKLEYAEFLAKAEGRGTPEPPPGE